MRDASQHRVTQADRLGELAGRALERGVAFADRGVQSPLAPRHHRRGLVHQKRDRRGRNQEEQGVEDSIGEVARLVTHRTAGDQLQTTGEHGQTGHAREGPCTAPPMGSGSSDHEQQVHGVVVRVVKEAVVVDQDQVHQPAVQDPKPQLDVQQQPRAIAHQQADPREREGYGDRDADRIRHRGQPEGQQNQDGREQKAQPQQLQQVLELKQELKELKGEIGACACASVGAREHLQLSTVGHRHSRA